VHAAKSDKSQNTICELRIIDKSNGLAIGPQINTPQVVAAQNWIINTYQIYQSWSALIYPILNNYPVQLNGAFEYELSTYYHNIQNNLYLLVTGVATSFPTSTCFQTDPWKCTGIQPAIESAMVAVTSAELNAAISQIEYQYELSCFYAVTLYPAGDGTYTYTNEVAQASGIDDFKAASLVINSKSLDGSFDFEDESVGSGVVSFAFQSNNNGAAYTGKVSFTVTGDVESDCDEQTSLSAAQNQYYAVFSSDNE